MLQNGHYEIDSNQGDGMPIVTRYVYRPRELAPVIQSIISTGGIIRAVREVEQPVEPVTQTTRERIAQGISEPCATCGAAAGDYCSDDCVWVVVGYGDPNT